MSTPHLQDFVDRLSQYSYRLDFHQCGALDEVEQEREVEVQVEAVRERQKPVQYIALFFQGLHSSILQFAKTGVLDANSGGVEHAFAYVANTEVGRKFVASSMESRLFVSKEFSRTVLLSRENQAAGDNFLRPVEWILWSPSTETAVIVIPEEAEQLIPILRRMVKKQAATQPPLVHLITYAAPVTRTMIPFNTLRYYSLPQIPPTYQFPWWFKVELGILSGRLYLDYEEWSHVANYIGSTFTEESVAADEDYADSQAMAERPFASNPEFLLEWLGVRRLSQDVLHTPMGYICMGRYVAADHPFFLQSAPAINDSSTEDDTVEDNWD